MKTLIRLLLYEQCSVCPDLSVQKLRVITVGTFIGSDAKVSFEPRSEKTGLRG